MLRWALYLSLSLFGILPAFGQSSLAGQEKRILAMTEDSWIHFRDYNGRQLVYFTHLEAYKCGIAAVHYSLNSEALDRNWKLQSCDPNAPHEVRNLPYLSLPLGSANMIAVQLTFNDGSKSRIVRVGSNNVRLDR